MYSMLTFAPMQKTIAIEKAGGVSRLADILGVTRSAVSQWRGDLPPLQAYRLRDLRPDWFVADAAAGIGSQNLSNAELQEAA